jgi:hypothetical protein
MARSPNSPMRDNRRLGAAGGCLLALLLASCAACSSSLGRPEQLILDEFFSASRLRDRTALERMATVVFEPRDQGIVTDYRITGVTEERGRDGARVTKNVSLIARVKLPSGQIGDRKLAITMQSAGGRWTITGVAVFPSSPRS